jgi:hypothetical protein
MVCVISQTTNITTKILAEVNQDVDELRPITVFFFLNRATISYLLLKHNSLACVALMC